MLLRELKPLHIQFYIVHALKKGRLDGKGGLSKRSVQYHYRILYEALQHAVDMDVLPKNPAAAVDPPVPDKKERSVLPPELVGPFLEAIKGTGIYYVPIYVAFATGMRREEILGLRWEDVNLEQGLAAVRQVLKRQNGKFFFGEPKTDKSRRVVVLPAAAIEVLEKHRKAQEERKRAMAGAYKDYGLICCRPNGMPVVPATLTSYSRNWIKRHPEFAGVTFHGLRHTHATLLMAAGVHPKVVSERLGHSSIQYRDNAQPVHPLAADPTKRSGRKDRPANILRPVDYRRNPTNPYTRLAVPVPQHRCRPPRGYMR